MNRMIKEKWYAQNNKFFQRTIYALPDELKGLLSKKSRSYLNEIFLIVESRALEDVAKFLPAYVLALSKLYKNRGRGRGQGCWGGHKVQSGVFLFILNIPSFYCKLFTDSEEFCLLNKI